VIPDYPSSDCWVEGNIVDDKVEVENGCRKKGTEKRGLSRLSGQNLPDPTRNRHLEAEALIFFQDNQLSGTVD
jgi:hypothetical protein